MERQHQQKHQQHQQHQEEEDEKEEKKVKLTQYQQGKHLAVKRRQCNGSGCICCISVPFMYGNELRKSA